MRRIALYCVCCQLHKLWLHEAIVAQPHTRVMRKSCSRGCPRFVIHVAVLSSTLTLWDRLAANQQTGCQPTLQCRPRLADWTAAVVLLPSLMRRCTDNDFGMIIHHFRVAGCAIDSAIAKTVHCKGSTRHMGWASAGVLTAGWRQKLAPSYQQFYTQLALHGHFFNNNSFSTATCFSTSLSTTTCVKQHVSTNCTLLQYRLWVHVQVSFMHSPCRTC